MLGNAVVSLEFSFPTGEIMGLVVPLGAVLCSYGGEAMWSK